ncbi:MAG: hypothetical protein KJ850_09795 [Gammaproteobacteria bacterium]|nr:hypothetical protein [Gammaproteobacteria bacterium]MBU1625321.1 hypothetical protein [Gammaproteobacteria bacterium]MBU1981581.1 hypothetical protein [Gammaproteobacteria bacterium]
MSEFWIVVSGIGIGILILISGIILDRNPGQTVNDAFVEGSRWGVWFLLVFGAQAFLLLAH